eukprot:CAMPEP_0174379062 /NCGR_PEP_ID=MMETSP0811_2-20130205/122462_1 /TAXON_ID=73025 ORGANISM="Eutreptiella gymnastica-like, Strain CCMP1594" /NCGR_SAMPLE_ID=MMETSP0811_2 /ASSEMBLY_ACC=CAM_ASM_000667 /LENGTH=56 /DNA_ID=CAMNT_0015531475 /DNA_START=106 /DNA_END=276 /DNA_ORIENTATION=+
MPFQPAPKGPVWATDSEAIHVGGRLASRGWRETALSCSAARDDPSVMVCDVGDRRF